MAIDFSSAVMPTFQFWFQPLFVQRVRRYRATGNMQVLMPGASAAGGNC